MGESGDELRPQELLTVFKLMLSGHRDRCLSHSLVTGISGLARAGC